jgi:hypothetical protein
MIPGFYALGAAWLFLLTVPVVIFYFLKLKRPRMNVPSLVLWRQVISDARVNSPFQRFKRNLLLLLQLLLLLLLVLAAMLPYLRGEVRRRRRLPVLVDCSASMAALDAPGGISRLGAAKKKVRRLIDGLPPGCELCLISFDRKARKRTGFTDEGRVLHAALAAIEVEDVTSRLDGALRITEALARGVSFDEVLLLSDGNFPAKVDFELPFGLDYERLPAAGQNFGITSLGAQASGDGGWLVFCRIEGSPDARASARVELVDVGEGGGTVGEREVSLEGGASQRMMFRIDGDRPWSLRLRLVPDGFDSLASDNVAYLDVPAARPLSVRVPPSMVAFRHALGVRERVDLYPEGESGPAAGAGVRMVVPPGPERPRVTIERPGPASVAPAGAPGGGAWDLLVSDTAADRKILARTSLFVGVVPEEVTKLVTVEQGGTEVVDWRRSSPLLQHVELADLVVLDRPCSREGSREGDYENLGYEVLVHGKEGPLVLEKREGDRLSFFLLFHTDRSTLPYRVGFPILLSNLVGVAAHQAGLDEVRGRKTGVLPPLALLPKTVYGVVGPDGKRREEKTNASGELRGIPAPRVGEYVVTGEGAPGPVGASLLSASETALEGVEEIQFSELSVSASAAPLEADRPLWPLLGLVGFCVLLFEWWFFHRRRGAFASAAGASGT